MKLTLTILFALLLFVSVAVQGQTKDTLPMPSWIVPGTMDGTPSFLHPIYWGDKPYTKPISMSDVVRESIIELYSRYEKEAYADSVAEKGFWFTDMYVGNGADRIANANEPGAWWRKWDSMGDLLEQSYKTKAVIRWIHPNAVPPNPFIQWMRKQR